MKGRLERSRSKVKAPSTRAARNAELALDQQRLELLKFQMAREKEAWEMKKTSGGKGYRWRSARPDKGAPRAMAREARSGKTARRQPPPADVTQWSKNHVCKWLRSALKFDKAQREVFRVEEIDGAALLDLTEGDFIALGVTTIGRRKALARAIAALRGSGGDARPAAAAAAATGPPASDAAARAPAEARALAEIRGAASKVEGGVVATASASFGTDTEDDGSINRCGGEVKAERSPPRLVHWSHGTQRTGTMGGGAEEEVPVNMADGAFDEAASHASFLEALNEWRTDNGVATTDGSGGGGASASAATSSSSASAATDGGGGGAGGGGGGAMWVNPFANLDAAPIPEEEPAPTRGGALLDGELDEAREHALFKAAVEEWRSGGASASASSASSSTASTSASTAKRGGGKRGRRRAPPSSTSEGGTGMEEDTAQRGMLDDLRAWIDDGYEAYDEVTGAKSPSPTAAASLQELAATVKSENERFSRNATPLAAATGEQGSKAAALPVPLIDPWTVELAF